ncbi:DJ-1/PfpI family protein [Methylorubrum extorquens]|uniref:DJ-1/PfpI family protein n=1 Tax=Methylorubrum extorquens TaxID=408 RepID=UPI004059E7B2
MESENLNGLKVGILVTDGFEQVEMTEPRKALDAAGAETRLVLPKDGQVKAWNFTEWGDTFPVDMPLDGAQPEEFDAILLPGGVINPDKLRALPAAVAFVKAFFDAGKPVASICHGPWTIIEAGAARGRRLTSWPVAEERPRERRGRVGGSAGRGRSGSCHEPQARRHPGLQPGGDRAVRRRRRAIATGGSGVRPPERDLPTQPALRSTRLLREEERAWSGARSAPCRATLR